MTLPATVPAGTDPDLDRALEILGGPGLGAVLRPAA